MAATGYAESIITLIQSGNAKGENIAIDMIHALAQYFFENDPQFKEKTK